MVAVWRQQLNDLLRFTEGRIGRAGRKCIYTGNANREVIKDRHKNPIPLKISEKT